MGTGRGQDGGWTGSGTWSGARWDQVQDKVRDMVRVKTGARQDQGRDRTGSGWGQNGQDGVRMEVGRGQG